MKDLRIVFMGTPEFAVGTLDALYKAGHTIAGVITAPDRPAGRGRKLNQSAVKTYALKKSLTVLQPTNLKNPNFITELTALEANLQIVVAFRMLPKVVWQLPQYGTFNLHASLLPEYRGAAPINWAIINGETKTGVTTFFIDEKIDTGAIILQEATPIFPNEDAGSLHDRLMILGAETVLKTVERIKQGDLSTTMQKNTTDLKMAHKLERENCTIDWTKDINAIRNLIRGLSPYPAAWTTLHNGKEILTLKIFKAEVENSPHKMGLGELIHTKKELKVAVKEGFVNLLEIQLQGKKRMNAQDLLNGLMLSDNAVLR